MNFSSEKLNSNERKETFLWSERVNSLKKKGILEETEGLGYNFDKPTFDIFSISEEYISDLKDINIQSNQETLSVLEHNKEKEILIIRARGFDRMRDKIAKDLGKALGVDGEYPRLLEISKHFSGEQGDKLRSMHAAMDLIVKRVQEHNKSNETLIECALKNLSSAMGAVKETISGKSTYQNQGKVEPGSSPGHIVSREV